MQIKYKKAFTMLELIFVIVILGIVASIGSEIIVQVYEQYILQRAQYRASNKTELAVLQVANRLHYMVPGTLYRIKTDGTKESFYATQTGVSSDYAGLQWVAADLDGFNNGFWTGMCDVKASTSSNIKTPGSNISTTSNHISNLGGSLSSSYIYFPHGYRYAISGGSGEDITVSIPTGSAIYEQYKLAWTSYAVIVENGDLYLYYNFTPTPGAPLGNTKSLLLKNAGNLKLHLSEGGTLRFKICKSENIGEDYNISSCKEKAVF